MLVWIFVYSKFKLIIVSFYLLLIFKTSLTQIYCEHRNLSASFRSHYISVDVTDSPIQELQFFSKIRYSHKINGPTLRYENAVSDGSGVIIYVNGTFTSDSNPDTIAFRKS